MSIEAKFDVAFIESICRIAGEYGVETFKLGEMEIAFGLSDDLAESLVETDDAVEQLGEVFRSRLEAVEGSIRELSLRVVNKTLVNAATDDDILLNPYAGLPNA